ncbi:MAG: molybdopterin molybdotransferase MoeA [Mariniblastus sp.]
MIPIEQAFQLIDEHVTRLPPTRLPLASSVGSVLANDIHSDVNSPPHDKSMMDGFAVMSDDVNDGKNNLSIVETIIAGDWPQHALESGQASRIMTGAPLPKNADAVVMVEQTEVESTDSGQRVKLLIDSIAPEKNILRQGVNFQTGQTVLSRGHIVRATDIGLMAEVGAGDIPTREKPTVAVLPTGNELVDHHSKPLRGQIRNSNGPMLVALAQQFGLEVTDLGSSVDDPGQLADMISEGLKHDVLLLSGGVSAGTMDLVPGILKDLGVVEVFHKVAVKPGKPIWFGVNNCEGKKRYVFGLPGNPVSSLVGFHLFVRRTLEKLLGSQTAQIPSEYGELHTQHETRGNRPTFWPAKRITNDQTVRKFEPLVWRGSSDLFALAEAQGLIRFQENSTVHPAGEKVEFFPFT